MPINSKIKSLYDALKADGADVGSEQEFSDWFQAPGEQGYNNRKYVYDTFKADGADVGKNYDEFESWLGLHAVQPQATQAGNRETLLSDMVAATKDATAIASGAPHVQVPEYGNAASGNMLGDYVGNGGLQGGTIGALQGVGQQDGGGNASQEGVTNTAPEPEPVIEPQQPTDVKQKFRPAELTEKEAGDDLAFMREVNRSQGDIPEGAPQEQDSRTYRMPNIDKAWKAGYSQSWGKINGLFDGLNYEKKNVTADLDNAVNSRYDGMSDQAIESELQKLSKEYKAGEWAGDEDVLRAHIRRLQMNLIAHEYGYKNFEDMSSHRGEAEYEMYKYQPAFDQEWLATYKGGPGENPLINQGKEIVKKQLIEDTMNGVNRPEGYYQTLPFQDEKFAKRYASWALKRAKVLGGMGFADVFNNGIKSWEAYIGAGLLESGAAEAMAQGAGYRDVGIAGGKYNTDFDAAAATAWNMAEDEYRRLTNAHSNEIWGNYASMGGGREARIMTSGEWAVSNMADNLTSHDLDKMIDNAWNTLGETKRKQIMLAAAQSLAKQYPGADPAEIVKTAQSMVRQQTIQRVLDYAKQQNAPKNVVDYFVRKVIEQNSIFKIQEAMARSRAGTTGDWQARDMAMQEYGKNHRIAGVAGTVVGMGLDPVTYISAGVGKGAATGTVKLIEKLGGATGRKWLTTTAGKVVTGAVGGAGNLGAFEGINEALEQLRWGGAQAVDLKTGLIKTTGYDAGKVGKAIFHGSTMGAGTGVVAPLVGNVWSPFMEATSTTAGKMGVKAGELFTGTIAEGTIFSIPDVYNAYTESENEIKSFSDKKSRNYIADEQERAKAIAKVREQRNETMLDMWTESVATMAGFKAKHIAERLYEVSKSGNGRVGFETRLRYMLDRKPDLALTKDEQAELERGGYADLKGLVDEYVEAEKNRRANSKPVTTGKPRPLELGTREEDMPYNRFVDLMNDGSISEAARAKMYYYITGHALPMSTVMYGHLAENRGRDGKVKGYTVQSIGANGVVTSREFTSRKRAENELQKINRQAELNTVDVGERYNEEVADKKLFDAACRAFAAENNLPVSVVYERLSEGPRERGSYYEQIAKIYKDMGDAYSTKQVRAEVEKRYNVDIQKIIKKEPNRRSDVEQMALDEYVRRLFPEKEATEGDAEDVSSGDATSDTDGGDAAGGVGSITDESDAVIVETLSRTGEDGMIHPAVLKGEDEVGVDIVSGNVVTLADGTIDVAGSDPDIVVVDANGERQMVSINDIASVGEVVDPNAVVDAAMQANSPVTGVEVGGSYQVMAEDNVPHQVEVLRDNGNGTVEVRVDGAEDSMPMMKAQLEAMLGIEQAQPGEPPMADTPPGDDMDAGSERYSFDPNADVVAMGEAGFSVNEVRYVVDYLNGKLNERELLNALGFYNTDTLTDEQIKSWVDSVVERASEFITDEAVESGEVRVESDEDEQSSGRADEVDVLPPTPSNVEVEPEEDIEAMPMLDDGNPDYSQVDASRAHDYLYSDESGLDKSEADEYVQAQIDAAEKALSKIDKKPLKMGTDLAKYRAEKQRRQEQLDAAKANVDYWERVKAIEADREARAAAERKAKDAEVITQAQAEEAQRQAEELAKQQEQAERGAGAVHPAIAEKWNNAPKIEGYKDEVVLANGERVPGTYYLVESGAVTPSHNASREFEKYEGFPVDENGNTINDRDYERDKDAQNITRSIADNYDSRALQTPVIVSKDGVVLSGNGRTMAGELAASNNTDGAYIEHLKNYGRKYGFSPEQVTSMKHPRAVFVPDADMPYTTDTFAKFNAQEMKGQSKTEQAVKLGKVVDDATFNQIVRAINDHEALGDFYGDTKAATEAINALRRAGAINDMQYAEMFDGDAVSDRGRQIIENMLIGKAFEGNPDVIRMLTEYKSFRQSVVTALNEISTNVALGKDYSLENELAQAIELAYKARKAGFKENELVSPYATQLNLFPFEDGETVADYNNAAVLLLADMLNDKRPTLLKKKLQDYNQQSAESAAGQMDIFAGGVKEKKEIIKTVLNTLHNGETEETSRPEQRGPVADERGGEASLQEDGAAGQPEQGESNIQGLESYSEEELRVIVDEHVRSAIADADMDAEITGIRFIGSRTTGTARADSDLDVLVEYQGTAREDSLFNVLNDEDNRLVIDGITVDINPITPGKSGTIEEFMKRNAGYKKETTVQEQIALAEQQTETTPSEAQKEAGNYKKGHVKIDGFDISIEQPKGSVRSGVDASGKSWRQKMNNTYGYIRGTEGVDGDHIDVFLSDDPSQGDVFVVDQVNNDGSFDEHKVMYGFNSEEEARQAYLSNYEDGWQGLGAITAVSKDEFKKWIGSSHRKTKPFAEYKNVKVEGEQADALRQPTGQTVDGDIARFHKETDSSGRTAIDEANYNADDLVAPLLVDGKKSHIGITHIVPDDINEPTYTRAYYDYANLIDPKTNKGWQAVGDKIDEWNASHKKDEQGFDDGDAPQVRFPSVDAALKFAEWFEGEDGTPPAPLYDRGGAEAGGVLPSAEEVALRDGLVEVLRGAGIEVVTDEAEGQRVLDAANRAADVLDEMKKRNQQQETALPEDESSFKGTAISSADGAKIIKNLESGKKASNQIPQRPNGDTPESARSNDSDAILPAKLQKVADNASVEEEKSSEALFEATKEKFGTTNDLREAGYILPDGTMLDFSGRYMVDKGRDTSHLRGRRAVDHRAIHEVGYDQDDNETGFITDMADFIGRGAIRIDANAGTINLSKVPTAKQARVLRMLILRNDGDVSVDFGNGYDSEHYAEYESARATRVLGDIDRYFNEGIKPQGNISFFRTENGEAYGFVRDGKIYIDPRVASAETPVHEYCHLWADALKRANPEAWERLKETMLGEKDVLEHVKRLYPELEGDELLGEVFSHYSGKRGAERLRADMEHEVKNAEGVFAKARVAVVFDKIRRALSRFWEMARDLFAGKNSMLNGMRAEDFADMAMNDLLRGFKPSVAERTKGERGSSIVFERGSSYRNSNGDVIPFESHAEQLNLFGTPQSGALRQHDISGKPTARNERVKRAQEMSDAELLKEMQRDIAEFEKLGRGDWGIQTACTDEYDRRHIKEYNAECERVRTMLDENNVDVEQAEQMLLDTIYTWREGFATADRSKLLAQFDTLNDYYAEKTDERDNADLYQEVESKQAISEADARNTETPTQQEVAPTTQQTEPAKPKKAAFDPSAIKLRKLKSGETCHVERRYQESGGFDFTGSEKVESDADLAYIFRNLENSAIENTFLVLIKNGKATILHVGMGGYAFSAGHLGAGVLAASQLRPDSVIFVHNHPSGTLQPSQQDVAMQEKVKKMFGADKVREAIIIDITSGKYSIFDSDGLGAKEKQRPTSAENEVPYKTYSFSQQVFAEGFVPGSTFQITDSDKAAEFISGHRLGERDKLSLIVLNRQNYVTGNIFLPWTTLDDIDINKAAGVIAKFIHQMGGESGILYGSGTISRGTLSPLARAISNYEVHLDDFISVEGKSAFQAGAMEPEVEYEAVPRNTEQQPTEVAENGVGYGEAFDSGISDEELAGYDAGRYSFAESITQGLVDLALKNTHDQQLRLNAMREFGGNLAKLRKIMNKQKAYDKGTVDDIVRLARMVMGSGFFKDMSAYEVKRLLAAIKKGVGVEDLTPIANNVVDMLVQHQLRESKNMLHKLMQVRGRKVDARGVEVQAGLDIDGQRMMSALKDGMSLSEDGLSTRINDCENRLGSDDEVIRKNAMSEYQGLMLAKEYHDNILSGEEEEIVLRNEKRQEQEKIYDFRREPVLDQDGNAIINQDGSVRTVERKTLKPEFKGAMTDENKQLRRNTEAAIERIEQSIRENRMERVTAYSDFMSDVAGDVRASRERAAAWRAEQQERIDAIHHNANSDLEGVPVQSQTKMPEGGLLAFNSNNDIVRLLFQPLATFEKMLRFFGRKAHNGEGYLFNRFMRGWADCSDKEWRSKRAAHEELDAKVRELFGKKAKRWSDLYEIERNKKHPGIPVEYWDNGERVRETMSQGEALSLVVWGKQKDAEAGLRRMGISEEDIETIKSHLDPKFLELANWVVEEFLPKRREYYNEVHERMFGAPMAAIEHYFPIVRNSRDVEKPSDITERDLGDTKPSTITGNIIKRQRTAAALDVHTDFFDHLLKHLDDMENWAAWAEFNRDINTLRNYKRFKNRVLNMHSVEYGSGKELWKAFDDACAIAAGVYHPSTKRGSGDNLAVNVAKGVTGAKIAFRFYTAAKQLLSLPAFWNGDAGLKELAKWENPVGAIIAWNWAMKNLPGFSKRWQSRQVGDVRLMDTDSDYAFWRNNMVRALSRGGMWANALVDGMTVAMGARAVYETKKKRYLRNGYSEEQAEKRAMQDAAINYNSSQQSSENAFLSSLQLDRTWWSTLMTVFRSASMGYQRRLTTGLRNLKNRMKKGYKAVSIEFMKKQMVRDGIDEATAEKAARRTYRWGGIRSMADVFVFGLVLPFFWNLGPYALYLLMGDDDDEKKDMLKDAAVHSLFGPVEGLTGGQAMSEIGNTWAGYLMSDNDKSLLNALRYHDYLSMPLGSDLQQIFNEAGNDSMAAWTDAFNLLVQAGIGVNPETFTDAWVAIADACDGDPQTTKEFALCFMRVMQVPQTQVDKLFIDELGMTARDAQKLNAMEMADRYARYKKFRNAPLLNWAYSPDESQKVAEKYRKRFLDNMQERMEHMDDEQLGWNFENPNDSERRKAVGKVYAKGKGVEDTAGQKPASNWKPETRRSQLKYQRLRDYNDLAEDVLLDVAIDQAKNRGDGETEKALRDAKKELTEIKRGKHTKTIDINGLGDGSADDDKAIMEELRARRKEILREHGVR